MRHFVQLHFIPLMLACIVFFTTVPFVESVLRLHARIKPAIEWDSAVTISRIVRPGDIIEIVYTATVHRQCPSDLRAFIVAPDGTVPIRFPTITGGYVRPSDDPQEIRIKVPMPLKADDGLAPLTPGVYTYRATATRYCPEGVENDDNIPDAAFLLEVR